MEAGWCQSLWESIPEQTVETAGGEDSTLEARLEDREFQSSLATQQDCESKPKRKKGL